MLGNFGTYFEIMFNNHPYIEYGWSNSRTVYMSGVESFIEVWKYVDNLGNEGDITIVYNDYGIKYDDLYSISWDRKSNAYIFGEKHRKDFEQAVAELYRLWKLEQTAEKFFNKKAGYRDLKEALR